MSDTGIHGNWDQHNGLDCRVYLNIKIRPNTSQSRYDMWNREQETVERAVEFTAVLEPEWSTVSSEHGRGGLKIFIQHEPE